MSAAASHSQERRNTQSQRALLAEFGALGAANVATGVQALAVVDENSERVYPSFQFTPDGHLLPVVRDVLATFESEDMSDWQKALWFTTPTGWLRDQRPVDLLASDPDAVLAGARALVARPFF